MQSPTINLCSFAQLENEVFAEQVVSPDYYKEHVSGHMDAHTL